MWPINKQFLYFFVFIFKLVRICIYIRTHIICILYIYFKREKIKIYIINMHNYNNFVVELNEIHEIKGEFYFFIIYLYMYYIIRF
jgi:hypothetical protein